jgi:hypothetical protein
MNCSRWSSSTRLWAGAGSHEGMPRAPLWRAVYLVTTDNSRGNHPVKYPYFTPVRRGLRHGIQPVVLPTPADRSRGALPPHPYRGPTNHPVRLKRLSNPTRAGANAPQRPNPSPASSTNRSARPVSRKPTDAPRRRARPPLITFTRGLRRIVDTHSHFCPEPDCSYHGWVGRGNIRVNGHPGGQPWRQLHRISCHVC